MPTSISLKISAVSTSNICSQLRMTFVSLPHEGIDEGNGTSASDGAGVGDAVGEDEVGVEDGSVVNDGACVG